MNPVNWFEIYVDDLERATKFYQEVLGVELTKLESPAGMDDFQMMAFPMDPESMGASGALCRMKDVKPGGNSVMVYFACQDCAVEASRVEAAGGKLVQEKFSIGQYGFLALASDTEGNMFGMHTPAEGES